MEEQKAIELLQQLRNKEVKELHITKDQFLPFRQVLVKQKDFKHFRGIAERGGGVSYQYLDEPRS
ncbi:MAG TPA: hypothetical protein VNM45_08240 [Bacillus sp. (in: firmicutes)]|nr:hypothetical protein [Bacillus sp. (in: firmicutes)]